MPGEPFPGFLGPSYATQSQAAACDRTLNYIFEALEIPYNTKTKAALFQRPGCKPFGPVPSGAPFPGRGAINFDANDTPNGAILGVSGNIFWEIDEFGNFTDWGRVVPDGKQAHLVANSASVGQMAIASGGELYILANGTFTHIVNDGVNFFGAKDVCFIDGYFLVISNTPNSQQFQISSLNNGLIWNGADVAILEGQADPIERCIVNVEYVYFVGLRRGEIWYNSGNPLFPFTIQPGAFLEVGTNAPGSVVQSAGTGGGLIYYIGQDSRGENVAVVVHGLSADIISTPAVSAAWSKYSTTDDCICYPYTWKGHSLIRYIFPTADAGWEYDITESGRVGFPAWNEVGFTDQNGVQHAPFERAHAYGIFGKHFLVSGGADGQPGQVYELDDATYQDCNGLNPYGVPVQGANSATMPSGLLSTDVLMDVAALTWTPVVGEYLMLGSFPDGEIVQLTAFTPIIAGTSTFTIVRGLGGSAAANYILDSIIFEATFPGFPITRDRIIRLPYNGGLNSIIDRLEFLINPGNGNEADPGLDPILVLSVADSFGPAGPIWGPDIEIPMGELGQYQLRALANRLGKYRDGAIRIRITDPVFAALAGCTQYIRKLTA